MEEDDARWKNGGKPAGGTESLYLQPFPTPSEHVLQLNSADTAASLHSGMFDGVELLMHKRGRLREEIKGGRRKRRSTADSRLREELRGRELREEVSTQEQEESKIEVEKNKRNTRREGSETRH